MIKTIEKENGQIFEICSSEKEFKEQLKDILWANEETWQDEDSNLYVEYKDGSYITIMAGDNTKNIKRSNIKKAHYSNPCTSLIYNCDIIYNAHYEDYEVNID